MIKQKFSEPSNGGGRWGYRSSDARCQTKLDPTQHLVGGVGKVGLVLGALSNSVVGKGSAAGSIRTGSGVGLEGIAVDTDGRLGGLGAGLAGGAADGAGALGDGSVGGVEVGGNRGLLGQGEAGDTLVDQVGLALGVGVDDGLGLGGVGVGRDVAAVGLRGLGLGLADVLLGHVESAVRHVDGCVCVWVGVSWVDMLVICHWNK